MTTKMFISEEPLDNESFNNIFDKNSNTGRSSKEMKEFESFMTVYGHGWVLINRSERMLSYHKIVPEQRGSCLLALVLLILGIIPGILYLYFSRVAAKTHQLVVHLNDNGTLSPSGDNEGMLVYQKFANKHNGVSGEITDSPHFILIVIVVLILIGTAWYLLSNSLPSEQKINSIATVKTEATTTPEQKKAAALQADKDKATEAAWAKTKAGKLCKLHADWSKDDCQNVIDRKYWIGMDLNMLKAERGTPDSANPSDYGDGTHWQWCWYDYTPSCFYGGSDGIVTSYN